MNTRQLNFVWVVLMLATLATYAIGEVGSQLGIVGPLAMAALLVISFVKGRLVALDFMGLRGVKFFWRGLLIGWLLLVSALLVFTDWFNGYTGYSLDLVVPILCCAALVCNFIFAFLRSRFTANALVYLLMNIGIGVLPYILLFFRIDYSGRLDAHSLPWVICLIVSVITFLGLVIFRGRALKNEIVKRLHM